MDQALAIKSDCQHLPISAKRVALGDQVKVSRRKGFGHSGPAVCDWDTFKKEERKNEIPSTLKPRGHVPIEW